MSSWGRNGFSPHWFSVVKCVCVCTCARARAYACIVGRCISLALLTGSPWTASTKSYKTGTKQHSFPLTKGSETYPLLVPLKGWPPLRTRHRSATLDRALKLRSAPYKAPELQLVSQGNRALVNLLGEMCNSNTNCCSVHFRAATSAHSGTFDFYSHQPQSSSKNFNKSVFSSVLKRLIYLFKVIIKF